MDFENWKGWYEEILNDFKFSQSDDVRTAEELDNILLDLNSLSLDELSDKVHNNRQTDKFIVFGAGPSLKENIINLKENYNLNDYILISADGATTALIEERIIPDIIVTDLDGRIDDILLANNKDSAVVVHAHGNNLDEIIKYVPFFDNILGTTQAQAHGNLYNFGGFTDGDRAIFLAVELGAHEILLAGMDFGDIVTQYSRPKNSEFLQEADDIKKKKLEYAERLTNWISENEDVKLEFLN